MSEDLIMKSAFFAAFVIVCTCMQPLQQVGNADEVREKRSLWGGAKPTGKTCLNFCKAVSGICGNGICEMNTHTCAIKCNCEPGYTGHWCSELTEQNQEPLEPSTKETEKDNSISPSSVTHSAQVTPSLPKATEKIVPSSDKSNKTIDQETVDQQTTELENVTEESENIPTGVDRTTDSILNKSNEYDSLEKCTMNCANGQCLNLNGFIRCFPISKTPKRNGTTEGKTSFCPGGFTCNHGDCDPQINNMIKCRCEPNWTGDLCHKYCPLDCGENGHCQIVDHITNKPGCNCDPKYTGPKCQDLKPTPIEEEELRHWYVIGVCVAVLFVLLVLIISLPYWMWRKRWIFIMKIVHYFQHYEEDDGKEYDAFISYKSSKDDEKFVLEQLYPKLEKELGFKLCMHFRDFIPGDAIANNVIRAIENSRRTIMVLSPNYIDSEWCRMEYQKAQHEMLKLKHKIIPVVLEDISNSKFIDKNLKTILNTVTYLEWPGVEQSKKLERFWKHLELSMPKKRSSSSDSEPLESVTVSSSPSQIHLLSGPSLTISPVIDSGISSKSDGTSNISNDTNNAGERPKGRLQRMMKELRKLRITIDSRQNSLESCPSTPITATPSPGVFLSRDNSPLIKSKGNSKHKQSKSSTWTARTLKESSTHILTQHNSLREIDRMRNSLDIVPQIQHCVSNQYKDLPDVCRTPDGGFLNIVCEAETPPPSPEGNVTDIKIVKNNTNTSCVTCVLNCDVDNNKIELLRTVSSTSTDDNEIIDEDDRKCKILELNIPPSNNNTKILNTDESFVPVYCNNKNCDCCRNLNSSDVTVTNKNIKNSSGISVETNLNINLPIAPARRKRTRKTVPSSLDNNGNELT